MFSSIDSSRNKINVWPVAKGFLRQTSREVFAEGVEAVAGSDSSILGLPTSPSVDIAQLKSTSVATHEHDRLRPMGVDSLRAWVWSVAFRFWVNLQTDSKQLCFWFSSILPLFSFCQFGQSYAWFTFVLQFNLTPTGVHACQIRLLCWFSVNETKLVVGVRNVGCSILVQLME